MADGNFRIISAAIGLTDVLIGANPGITNLAQAGRRSTPNDLFIRLLRTFPTSLNAAERTAIRNALSISAGGISESAARSLIATWARATGATGTVPDNRIPANITRDAELSSAISSVIGGAGASYNTLAKLAALFLTFRSLPSGGANGQFVSLVAGQPAWVAAPTGGTVLPAGTDGQILVRRGNAWVASNELITADGEIAILERKTSDLMVTSHTDWVNNVRVEQGGFVLKGINEGDPRSAFAVSAPANAAGSSDFYTMLLRLPTGSDVADFRITVNNIVVPDHQWSRGLVNILVGDTRYDEYSNVGGIELLPRGGTVRVQRSTRVYQTIFIGDVPAPTRDSSPATKAYVDALAIMAGAFVPTKANLYAAVKAIFHPTTNAGVTADDDNNELDVTAGASDVPQPGERALQIGPTSDPGDSAAYSRTDHVHALPLADESLEFTPRDQLRAKNPIHVYDHLPTRLGANELAVLTSDDTHPVTPHELDFEPVMLATDVVGATAVDVPVIGDFPALPTNNPAESGIDARSIAAIWQRTGDSDPHSVAGDLHLLVLASAVSAGVAAGTAFLRIRFSPYHGPAQRYTLFSAGANVTIGGTTYAHLRAEAEQDFLSLYEGGPDHFIAGIEVTANGWLQQDGTIVARGIDHFAGIYRGLPDGTPTTLLDPIATPDEARAGNLILPRRWSPQLIAQAIAALSGAGGNPITWGDNLPSTAVDGAIHFKTGTAPGIYGRTGNAWGLILSITAGGGGGESGGVEEVLAYSAADIAAGSSITLPEDYAEYDMLVMSIELGNFTAGQNYGDTRWPVVIPIKTLSEGIETSPNFTREILLGMIVRDGSNVILRAGWTRSTRVLDNRSGLANWEYVALMKVGSAGTSAATAHTIETTTIRAVPQNVVVWGWFEPNELTGSPALPPEPRVGTDISINDNGVSRLTNRWFSYPVSRAIAGKSNQATFWRAETLARFQGTGWSAGAFSRTTPFTGGQVFADDAQGTNPSDTDSATKTHYAYRQSDGTLSRWFAKGGAFAARRLIRNITAGSSWYASDHALPVTAENGDLGQYRYLEFHWIEYAPNYAFRTIEYVARFPVEEIDTVLATTDGRHAGKAYRVLLGGPNNVATVHRVSENHPLPSSWTGSGCVIDIEFHAASSGGKVVTAVEFRASSLVPVGGTMEIHGRP